MAWMYASWYALIGVCLSSVGLVGMGAVLSLWACYYINRRLSTRSTWSELYSSKTVLGQSSSTSATKEDVCRVDVDVEDYGLITDELCPATVTAGVGTLRQVAVFSLHDLLLGLATLRPAGKKRESPTAPTSAPIKDRDVGPPTLENVSMPRPNTERRMSLLNRHLPVCETLEGELVPVPDIPAYMVTTTSTETMNNPIAPMMSPTAPTSAPIKDTDRDVGPPTLENVSMPRPNTERRMSLLNRHLPVCETLEGELVPVPDIPAYMVTTTSTETMNNPIAPMMSPTAPTSAPIKDTDRDVGPPTLENVSMPRPNTERRMSLLNRHLPVCETLEGELVPASDIPAYMVTTTSVAKPVVPIATSPPPCMGVHSTYVSATTPKDTDAFRAYVNDQVDAIFHEDCTRRETFLSIVEEILFASTAQLVTDAVFRAFRVSLGVLRHWELEHTLVGAIPTEAQGEITYQVQFVLNIISFTWDKHKYGDDFLQTMSQIAQHLREQERQPTCSEYLAFQLAYYKLSKGHRLDLSAHMPIGSPGFRPHTQTYLSVSDPGEGHVLATTRHMNWMHGVIIHVETKGPRTEEYLADKRPFLLDLSKVRLHTGSAAPTSTSVGTVVHSEYGGFEEQFEHIVYVVSSEATAAFHRGAAEYKVPMAGLRTSQAVRYMRAITCCVSRERFSQHLSATWTLNQIIFDDYERENPKHLVNNKDIAMRILEITSLGGFDGVCLKGGSGDSKDMLGFEDALVFNHQAHMLGLVTYVSGIKFNEIKHNVHAGVDVIGTGGAKALRNMDSESSVLGFHTKDIQLILQSRDDVAKSVRGRGAHLLVKLDTMLFEGSISHQQNLLREQLFKALQSKRKAEIENLLNELHVVCCEDTASRHLVEGTAGRLCRAAAPLLQLCSESETEWRVFIARLRIFVHAKDYINLVEEYESEPWLTYRQKYTDKLKAMTV